ncbi:geranylgeranylglyceryl phosphate synthase [Nonlabens sp. YIK11]|uniref:geranylgeranylglyceryl/heptaprenylglyceryl phosphate synthase n=1 Tax=Nonlabens sp. YIK11 TaxID=1453349 RepID=UPI0006DD300A|nr:geranylgeranylglyceryl/heptaprenylglyceryl phosphate synthase [Nonlabens sp. YIK11]KQC32226.1 geranylgeranylglyceryl phosphate synthase [Nonlabens sp. YIK11]
MEILKSICEFERTLGILVDPEKLKVDDFSAFAKAITSTGSILTKDLGLDQIILLIGGSTMEHVDLEAWLGAFRQQIDFKLVLFPGSAQQISERADALLFLNLISGRNPEYLIGQQIEAAKKLRNSALEIIPTAYLLLDGDQQTAVERVSKTQPIRQSEVDLITDTALAGQLMGNNLIYLEAGSGAKTPVSIEVLKKVVETIHVPVIVGGGLCSINQIKKRFEAGAKMVVVGTAMEEDINWKG